MRSSQLFEDSSNEEFEGASSESEPESSGSSKTNQARGLKRVAPNPRENPPKKTRVLSSKELDILKRQRQMATQISIKAVVKKEKNGETSSKLKTTNKDLVHQISSQHSHPQQKLLQKVIQKQRLQQILKPMETSTISSKMSAVKNHTHPLRHHNQKTMEAFKSSPTTAESALAEARNRLKLNPAPKQSIKNEIKATSNVVTKKLSSKPVHIRAPMRKRLLPSKKNNDSSSSSSSFVIKKLSETSFTRVEPEDYWRMIRRWDFLNALNRHVQLQQNRNPNPGKKNRQNFYEKQNQSSSRGYVTKNAPSPTSISPNNNALSKQKPKPNHDNTPLPCNTKPIPDHFSSAHQYKALWAPLCLREAAAQILSEFVSNFAAAKRCKNPLKVLVSPMKKDVGGTNDYITVQIRLPDSHGSRTFGGGNNRNNNGRDNSNDSSLMTNDIIILTKDSKVTQFALQGKLQEQDIIHIDNNNDDGSSLFIGETESDIKRLGILGQVEQFRRTPDGSCIRISRKLWSLAGASEMFLVKLGSNITAMREFTALCRVDTIPLLQDILCDKLKSEIIDESATNKVPPRQKTSIKSSCPKNKADLIANMGGAGALGKGFTQYASKKFNASQLGAISAAAQGYGEGGFTLVKGPPGTGKTTTLVALLNSLHIRQFNKYYNEVGKIAAVFDSGGSSKSSVALEDAAKNKPRLLVCAPSNAAVDNVILKIMADGFVDGNGSRYNPSMVRIGVGQSAAVKDIALEAKVDSILAEGTDLAQLDASIAGYRVELIRLQKDISKLRRRIQALTVASPWPLSREWEIRIDEKTFDRSGRVYFVNHKEKRTSYEIPPQAKPGEQQYAATSMPEYRTHLGAIVKLVERYNTITSKLKRTKLVRTVSEQLSKGDNGHSQSISNVRQQLETHVVDSVHIVLTTLGTAGSRTLEMAEKFEVVVIDEAAQSVEPGTLVALQLGSSQAILVGDPQQLPATIFSVSGRSMKYERSLFQRLEEAGYPVHLLDTQYRMHPCISNFPRRIFYDGQLLDGPNVKHPEYGNPLHKVVISKLPNFQPFTVLDLDSSEERGGTSLSNSSEARLAVHLYNTLANVTGNFPSRSTVAVITPYAQQAGLLRRTFSQRLGQDYSRKVEINTVDAFQGRESNIVIFSCVRAAGSKGIGFLSDVRRMNVALTRAKDFLFVIARCSSIVVNPYWRDLVDHARDNKAIIKVPLLRSQSFPDLKHLDPLPPLPRKRNIPIVSTKKKIGKGTKETSTNNENIEDGEVDALFV